MAISGMDIVGGGWMKKFAPFMAMLVLEITDVGVTSLGKAAMSKGMNTYAFVTIFNLLATFLLLLPFLLFRRKRIQLTLPHLCRYAVLGLMGSSFQILVFAGIKLSSPTLSSTIGNIEPIFTLLIAFTLRIEKFDLRSGIAVFVGSAVCVSGALIVTLYKGPRLLTQSILLTSSIDSSWILGGLLLTIGWILSALWHIYQTTTILVAPDMMTNLFFFAIFSTIFSGMFSLCMIRDSREWMLTSRIEIIAIAYTAIFGMIGKRLIHIWCLQVRGPIFVTMFRPLGIGIAMVIGILLLGDFLYLGRIVGAIILSVGFYIVMWGKSKQQQQQQQQQQEDEVQCPESINQYRNPLLENTTKDEIQSMNI